MELKALKLHKWWTHVVSWQPTINTKTFKQQQNWKLKAKSQKQMNNTSKSLAKWKDNNVEPLKVKILTMMDFEIAKLAPPYFTMKINTQHEMMLKIFYFHIFSRTKFG